MVGSFFPVNRRLSDESVAFHNHLPIPEDKMEEKPIDDHVRKQYIEEFDSNYYLGKFFKEVYQSEKFTLNKLQETFEKGNLEGPLKRCIDIGCGPIVHRFSAPSRVCDVLVYSDYSDKNLDLIKSWLLQPIPDRRHQHLFQYCAEIEGFEDPEKGAIEIETRVKTRVSGVIPINILNPVPIDQLDEPFDVAFSGACLEAACDSYENYVTAVKNIATILRPGGYLLIKGFTDGNYYVVKDIKFPCLNQTIEMVKKGLFEGGYRIVDIEEVAQEHRGDFDDFDSDVDNRGCSNCKSCFFAIAQKL